MMGGWKLQGWNGYEPGLVQHDISKLHYHHEDQRMIPSN
jgi:hypothetical protein